MNNISYCLLHWFNDKGYHYQSYNNTNKMPEIDILVDNFGCQNKNNVMIHFLNMIKGVVFFGTDHFHFYIKSHTKTMTNHLTALIWCAGSKISLLLRSAVKFWIPSIMLRLFKYSMKMDDLYGRPGHKTVYINHVFQVKNELAYICYCQEFHG